MKLPGYSGSTFIFAFTGLDENGECLYNVSVESKLAECRDVSQACRDDRAIGLEVAQKTGLIRTSTFEDYKTIAASCCEKKLCSKDRLAYYHLSSIDNSAITSWYKLGELGYEETLDGLLIYNERRADYPTYLVREGGLCTYTRKECESDERCYGGGAWVGCCRPQKCIDNAIYEINETKIFQDAEEKSSMDCDDYYVLKQRCGNEERCVELKDGTAVCESTQGS